MMSINICTSMPDTIVHAYIHIPIIYSLVTITYILFLAISYFSQLSIIFLIACLVYLMSKIYLIYVIDMYANDRYRYALYTKSICSYDLNSDHSLHFFILTIH